MFMREIYINDSYPRNRFEREKVRKREHVLEGQENYWYHQKKLNRPKTLRKRGEDENINATSTTSKLNSLVCVCN